MKMQIDLSWAAGNSTVRTYRGKVNWGIKKKKKYAAIYAALSYQILKQDCGGFLVNL